MIKIERREEVLFYITGVVISLAVLLNFIVIPTTEKIKNLREKVAILEQKAQRYQWLIDNQESLRKAYAGLPSLPGGFNFSVKQDSSTFLKNLEAISRQSGLRLIEMRPLEASSSKGSHLSVELRQQGSMPQIIAFLYDLEVLAGFVVEKVQISSNASVDALEADLLVRSD
jgi:hypothetical protein